MGTQLRGPRYELNVNDSDYPAALREIPKRPDKLYVIGDVGALEPGLAVIGARRATPYGKSCAHRFARIAAERGVVIISGGAHGCDAQAHRAALDAGGRTAVFLGGGCDQLYPRDHAGLFQSIIDAGGAVVSEHSWSFRPLPYTFRERNRLIAGLARAVLIVEAGLPSGTFSTADEALALGKEVLVVPGAITSEASHGSNRLLYQGAFPVVDDESFEDVMFSVLGTLKMPLEAAAARDNNPVIAAVLAAPISFDELFGIAEQMHGHEEARTYLMETLAQAEADGIIARQADGRWCAKARA